MGDFPYGVKAVEVNAPGPCAPFPVSIGINDWGEALVPNAFLPGAHVFLPVVRGLALGWAPWPEVGGVLLSMFGGNPTEPSDESIAVTLSRDGLKALIRDLHSIDEQLGEG